MKVLIYGAGVIGCFLAHTLCSAGQQVTLLARGEWKETLERNGLVIHHSLQRKTTVDYPRIAIAAGEERYDVVFAVMQYQQMKESMTELAEINTPLLVCVGNNMSAARMEKEILSKSKNKKRVLFGFQGTGGRRENGKVECVRFLEGSMSLGGLHGEIDDKIKRRIGRLFLGTRYRLTWVPDMDAWYHCHLVLILPACYVCYATGCDLRRASRRQRTWLLNAAEEGCGLLKALGYPIYPEGGEKYYQPGIRRALFAAVLFLMAKTKIGDLAASDHCRHAAEEMKRLDKAWADMRRRKPEYPMPAWDRLHREMPKWSVLCRAAQAPFVFEHTSDHNLTVN